MKREWDTVKLLSHARHDWLNKIQLIKGNLALNNVDRVKEIIDEIVLEAQQESKLSNLHLPQFASLLLTYNWKHPSIHLEYEVIDGRNEQMVKVNDQLLTEWTNLLLEKLQAVIKLYEENHLSVTIEKQLDGIRFFFDFRGIITEKEQLLLFLEKKSSIEVNVHELSEQELALEVYVQVSEEW